MQTKTIEHPLKEIILEIDESKPWTTEDEQLLQSYIEVHDYELLNKESIAGLFPKFATHSDEIKETKKKLDLVSGIILRTHQTIRDYILQMKSPDPQAFPELADQVNRTSEVIQQYHQELEKLEQKHKELYKVLDEYYDRECECEPWMAFSHMTSAHFKNYETNAIEICHFDELSEKFRTYVSFLHSEQKRIIDFCNTIINEYNILIHQTEAQYALWKEATLYVMAITKNRPNNMEWHDTSEKDEDED